MERVVHDGIVAAVVSAASGEHLGAAALHHLYREQDGVITLPSLAVTGDPEGWSPADWTFDDDEWLPDEVGRQWEKNLTTAACSGTTARWHATFRKYLGTLVRACKAARKTLRTRGVVDRNFVVVLLDDEHHAELIRRVLPASDVRRLFPELDERTAELARLQGLPPADRAAELVGRLGRFDGPLMSEDIEDALRALGRDAWPALIPLLTVRDRAWQAARLLADIGEPGDEVVAALTTALRKAKGPDLAWTAVALSRLGRLDVVLDRRSALPTDVVAGAVAAPYTSFRNSAVRFAPLDYTPLADVLTRWPGYSPALDDCLRPGRGSCAITPDEAATAIEALSSPHPLIRRHAAGVLGERNLGRHVLPALAATARNDPDPAVRRMAILSLLFWKKDSRHLEDQIRHLLDDPSTEVRDAAALWLREQTAHSR
ncbi:HEAT repeat domain-containing protein [Actinoplanes sp. LDG1-06]|uniref:HEAT repeat domain-containing protein n=2 Tax=Paractinoplanes ovalisporus TaxID=2810368 RepID=A0ABS2AK31_9ACTN|nr:HEAT repeat domain-containing protein [Actinoplanes ovalisporus]